MTKQEDNTGSKLIETERTVVRLYSEIESYKNDIYNGMGKMALHNCGLEISLTSRRQRVVLRGNFSNWSPAISDAISVIEVQYNQRI